MHECCPLFIYCKEKLPKTQAKKGSNIMDNDSSDGECKINTDDRKCTDTNQHDDDESTETEDDNDDPIPSTGEN